MLLHGVFVWDQGKWKWRPNNEDIMPWNDNDDSSPSGSPLTSPQYTPQESQSKPTPTPPAHRPQTARAPPMSTLSEVKKVQPKEKPVQRPQTARRWVKPAAPRQIPPRQCLTPRVLGLSWQAKPTVNAKHSRPKTAKYSTKRSSAENHWERTPRFRTRPRSAPATKKSKSLLKSAVIKSTPERCVLNTSLRPSDEQRVMSSFKMFVSSYDRKT